MNDATNIKASAVEKAIRLLKASGSQYCVLFEDMRFGDLEVVEKKLRTRKVSGIHFRDLYKDKINALAEGDEVRIEIETEHGDALRGAVTAYASKLWGSGSYISAIDKTANGKSTVSLLRV